MRTSVFWCVLLVAACNSAERTPSRAACGGECPTGTACGADDQCHPNAPDTMLVGSPPALGNSATATFRFESTMPGATFSCRVDDAEPVACVSPFEATVGEGSHVFTVIATADGLPDETAARHAWRVDLTPPDTTVVGPTLTNQPSVLLGVVALEEGARLECSVDGGITWSDCPTSGEFDSLAEGSHTVWARGIDAAGNVDPKPAKDKFRVV